MKGKKPETAVSSNADPTGIVKLSSMGDGMSSTSVLIPPPTTDSIIAEKKDKSKNPNPKRKDIAPVAM